MHNNVTFTSVSKALDLTVFGVTVKGHQKGSVSVKKRLQKYIFLIHFIIFHLESVESIELVRNKPVDVVCLLLSP